MIRLPPTGISLTEDDLHCHLQRILLRHTLVASFSKLSIDDEDGIQEDATAVDSCVVSQDSLSSAGVSDLDNDFGSDTGVTTKGPLCMDCRSNNNAPSTGSGGQSSSTSQNHRESSIIETGSRKITELSMLDNGSSYYAWIRRRIAPSRTRFVNCLMEQRQHSPDEVQLKNAHIGNVLNQSSPSWHLGISPLVLCEGHRHSESNPKTRTLVIQTTPQSVSLQDTYLVEIPLLQFVMGASGNSEDTIPIVEMPIRSVLPGDQVKKSENIKELHSEEARSDLKLAPSLSGGTGIDTNLRSQIAHTPDTRPDGIRNNRISSHSESSRVTGNKPQVSRRILAESCLSSHVDPEKRTNRELHKPTRVALCVIRPAGELGPKNVSSTLAQASPIDQDDTDGTELRDSLSPGSTVCAHSDENPPTNDSHVPLGARGAIDGENRSRVPADTTDSPDSMTTVDLATDASGQESTSSEKHCDTSDDHHQESPNDHSAVPVNASQHNYARIRQDDPNSPNKTSAQDDIGNTAPLDGRQEIEDNDTDPMSVSSTDGSEGEEHVGSDAPHGGDAWGNGPTQRRLGEIAEESLHFRNYCNQMIADLDKEADAADAEERAFAAALRRGIVDQRANGINNRPRLE